MVSEAQTAALATFEQFLQYMREGAVPGRNAQKIAPEPSEFAEESTDPSMAIPLKQATKDGFHEQPTRSAPGDSAAMAREMRGGSANARRKQTTDDEWEEPTHVVGGPPASAPAQRPSRPPPASIIVDDAAAEPDEFQELRALLGGPGFGAGERFVAEMNVLLKFGHPAQVQRELQKFYRAHPSDLYALVRAAEFEQARLDPATGLERLFNLAVRSLEAGDHTLARRVLERLLTAAPGDIRVLSLRDRLSRMR